MSVCEFKREGVGCDREATCVVRSPYRTIRACEEHGCEMYVELTKAGLNMEKEDIMSEEAQTTEIKEGTYKGRAVLESAQFGQTENGTDQIVLELDIPQLKRRVQTFLYFSEKAAPYSIERLRKLGWDNDDPTNLSGIDKNEVDVEIQYEMYDKGDGSSPKRQMRVNIVSAGRVQIQQFSEDEKRAFRARVMAIMGKKPDAPGTSFPFGANAPAPVPAAAAPPGFAKPSEKAGF